MSDDLLLEYARMVREAEEAVRQKIAEQQLGEAFTDMESDND